MSNETNLPDTITVREYSIEAYAVNLNEKLKFAEVLRRSGMVPAAFTTNSAVLTAILYGQELGFSPLQAVNSIIVLNGKPTLDAASMKALALQNGGKIETVKWDEDICTLKGHRGDWVEEVSYTMRDAELQGLLKPSKSGAPTNWEKMPKAMLYARAVSILCRNMWADKLKGFYSAEEMRDSITVEVASKPQVGDVVAKAYNGSAVIENIVEPATEGASVIDHVEEPIAPPKPPAKAKAPANIQTGPGGDYWGKFAYSYAVPFPRKDYFNPMLKSAGAKFNGKKNRDGTINPSGDNRWYCSTWIEELRDFAYANAEQIPGIDESPAVEMVSFGDDDIPF